MNYDQASTWRVNEKNTVVSFLRNRTNYALVTSQLYTLYEVLIVSLQLQPAADTWISGYKYYTI